MRLRLPALAALALSAVGGPAVAQDVAVRSITALSGQCGSLAVVGQDITADCSETLLVSAYASDRLSIGFVVTRGPGAMHFSGREHALATQGGDTVLPLDRIILVGPGDTKDTLILGAGECRWGDFSAGAAAISCRFVADDGTPATGAFQTDGAAPRALHP